METPRPRASPKLPCQQRQVPAAELWCAADEHAQEPQIAHSQSAQMTVASLALLVPRNRNDSHMIRPCQPSFWLKFRKNSDG